MYLSLQFKDLHEESVRLERERTLTNTMHNDFLLNGELYAANKVMLTQQQEA